MGGLCEAGAGGGGVWAARQESRGRVRLVGVGILDRTRCRAVEMHVVAAAVHEDLDVVDVDLAVERELDGEAGLLLVPSLHATGVDAQLDRSLMCRRGQRADQGE